MSRKPPAAVLLAAARTSPHILQQFPLEEVAGSLADWQRPIDQPLTIPVSAADARGTVRRMSVEKASIVARYAAGDEQTFKALWADRRITVRRALAVNPGVPAALRTEWLKRRRETTKRADLSDRITLALLAGTLAGEGADEHLETAGAAGALKNATPYQWQDILQEMPGELLWNVLKGLDLPADMTLHLLRSCGRHIPESARPDSSELAELLERTIADGGRIRAGSDGPVWLDRLYADALLELPEQLSGVAYSGAEALSPRSWSSEASRLRLQLLERVVRGRAEGRDIPAPERIHPAHLAEVCSAAAGKTTELDETLLQSLVAGLALFGSAAEQLQEVFANGGRLNTSTLNAEVWQKRSEQLQERGLRHGDALRIAAMADAAVALTEPAALAALPEGLTRICRERSRDLDVLERLLDAGVISRADLSARLAVEDGYDLEPETLCRLVIGGRLTLDEAVDGLDIRALPYLQRGMRSEASANGESPQIMSHEAGAAGLQESFQKISPQKRLRLVAGLNSRQGGTAMWAASAAALAPLLQESLKQPDAEILQQLQHERNRETSPSGTLSAVLTMLMLAGVEPDARTGIDGSLITDEDGPLKRGLGRSMTARLADMADTLPTADLQRLLLKAAGHLRPSDLTSGDAAALPVAETLAALLGEEPAAWRMFASMADEWQGSLRMLADAVKQLASGS